MDETLKKQFEEFCSDIGMSMTTAFTVFAKKAVRENRIPFEVGRNMPNTDTMEAMKEVERMREDPTIGKTYQDVDEMMEDLLRENI